MAWSRMLAVLVAALALAGCYETASDVPAISDARRVAESPFAPGIWCSTDVSFDGEGAVSTVKLQDCFNVSFASGLLSVEKLHPDEDDRKEGPIVFAIAALNRGASLLQTRNEVDKRYELYVATSRVDGIAVLPELKLTPMIAAEASALGITIKKNATDDDFRILSGRPDAVFKLIEHAAGMRFDDGVRDRALWNEMMTKSFFFLPFKSDPKAVPPEPAALVAQLERLRTGIRFAMTLE